MPCRTRNNCIYYIALHHIKSRGKSLNMLSKRRGIASNNKKKQKEKKADEQKPSILFLYHCSRDTITVLPRQPIEILNLR